MHYLYIIFSEKTDKFYIGETHDIESRIKKHKAHSYENSFTKIADDWKLSLSFECQNRKEALFLEKFIKRIKSKKFIERIVENPEILKDILSKNK